MSRNAAVLQVSSELLGEMLRLKTGINIRGVRYDTFTGRVDILLEGSSLPDVPEGVRPMNIDYQEVVKMTPMIVASNPE